MLRTQLTLVADARTANPVRKALFCGVYLSRANRLGLAAPLYFLARNPLTRMESYFRHVFRNGRRDKFIRAAHTPMLKACGFSEDLLAGDRATRCKNLRPLQLEQAVLALRDPVVRRCFLSEVHSAPQVAAMRINRPRLPGALGWLPFDRILKIEAAGDRAFMEQELRIDLSVRKNDTHKPGEDLYRPVFAWTRAMREVMYATYREDFDRLGYDPFAD